MKSGVRGLRAVLIDCTSRWIDGGDDGPGFCKAAVSLLLVGLIVSRGNLAHDGALTAPD
jgi:hypothetical protein